MTIPEQASAAWQDVDCHLMQDMGGVCVYAYNAKEVNEARAADAQQIAALRAELSGIDGLLARRDALDRIEGRTNKILATIAAAQSADPKADSTKVVVLTAKNQELEAENARLRDNRTEFETVVKLDDAEQQIAALRAENEQLHSASKQAAVALVDWVWRAKESEAQLTALQAELVKTREWHPEVLRLRDWYKSWVMGDLTERDRREAESTLAALTAQQETPTT